MGVLACDRRDCENIMCDRYSPTYGYICEDCFTEMTALVSATRFSDPHEFMVSKKRKPDVRAATYAYCDNLFPKTQ